MRERRPPEVELAIRALGSPTRLAKLVGVKAPSVHSWTRIPADKVVTIAAATGIPVHVLRPDVFPAPATPEAA